MHRISLPFSPLVIALACNFRSPKCSEPTRRQRIPTDAFLFSPGV